MFKILLKLKHWQIFLIMVGGIIIFEIIMFAVMFSMITPIAQTEREPEPEEIAQILRGMFMVIPLFALFVMYFRYGWQWAIVNEFKSKLPANVKIPYNRIKAFFIIPIAFTLIALVGVLFFATEVAGNPEAWFENDQPPLWLFTFVLAMLPVNLFSTFCIFHNYVFTAKVLKSVELQKDAKFEDYAGDFFCIWFQIIGIWIIQGRINKIYAGQIGQNNSPDLVDDVS